MRRRLADADEAPNFLPGFRVGLRPCVHHEHDHMTNHADGLPAFFSGGWIAPTDHQGITDKVILAPPRFRNAPKEIAQDIRSGYHALDRTPN